MIAYLLSLWCRLLALVTVIVVAGWVSRTGYVWTVWHTAIAVLAAVVVAGTAWLTVTARPPWEVRRDA